jgi:hypothetical protein
MERIGLTNRVSNYPFWAGPKPSFFSYPWIVFYTPLVIPLIRDKRLYAKWWLVLGIIISSGKDALVLGAIMAITLITIEFGYGNPFSANTYVKTSYPTPIMGNSMPSCCMSGNLYYPKAYNALLASNVPFLTQINLKAR